MTPDQSHGRTPGASGYRRGCRCPVCTEGQRERQAAYNARRRGKVQPPAGTPGELERLAAAAVAQIGATGAAADLLGAQALAAARVLDEARASGRPHLMSPANRTLNDSLDRLRKLAAKPGREMSPDEWDADRFIASLTPMGPGTIPRIPLL